MTERLPAGEALAAAPAGSHWGRMVSRTYLVLAALAVALMVRELVAGRSGPGTLAISILTAPWSVLLASLAGALAPKLDAAAMRGVGVVLVVLSSLLNARILYGMAARAERDARAARSPGGTSNG